MPAIINLKQRVILIGLLLFAFFIRLDTLASHPLWFDEAMEFWVATTSLNELLPAVKDSLQDPPAYSILLHFWLNFGRDEFSLRLLSTYFSLISIATIFTLGKTVHSSHAGIFAALFLTFLPPDIRFAQEVGQYALLLLTLFLNLLALVYARRTNLWRYWFAWIITGIIGIYNYYGAWLTIIAAASVVFGEHFYKRKQEYLLRQGLSSIIFLFLALPLLLFWLPQQLFRGPTSNAFRISLNSFAAEANSFFVKTKNLLAYQFTGYIADPAPWLVLTQFAWVLLLLLLVLSLYSLTKSINHAYIINWLLVAWVLYYVAGRIGAYPYGGSRHALILTPLLLLTAAIGIAVLWRAQRLLSVVVAVAFILVAAIAPREQPQDLRVVVNQYLVKRQEAVPTYVYYSAVPGFRYQMQLSEGMAEDLPGIWYRGCWAGESHLYCSEDGIFYGRWMRALPANEKFAEILAALPPSTSEFWIVFSHVTSAEQHEVLTVLQEMYNIQDMIEATGASAYLLRKP